MRKTAILTIVVFVFGMAVEVVKADLTFGQPTNLGPIVNSSARDRELSISADGLSLYFGSDRPGGYGGRDLWVSTRKMTDLPWGLPVNLGPNVNSSAPDGQPAIQADGLTLLFDSDRRGGKGGRDIWMTTRTAKENTWGKPVNLGSPINTPFQDARPWISQDGLSLYLSSRRPGGHGASDLYVSTRANVNEPWGEPVNLGPTVNSTSYDNGPYATIDGLCLFFASGRPGGHGLSDIWLSRRKTVEENWGAPVNLGSIVNGPAREGGPRISSDGRVLYFYSNQPGGIGDHDLWQVSIEPIVALNSNGIDDFTLKFHEE